MHFALSQFVNAILNEHMSDVTNEQCTGESNQNYIESNWVSPKSPSPSCVALTDEYTLLSD